MLACASSPPAAELAFAGHPVLVQHRGLGRRSSSCRSSPTRRYQTPSPLHIEDRLERCFRAICYRHANEGVRIHEKHRCPATAGPAPARLCHRPLRRDVPQADRAIRPRDGDEEGHTGSACRTWRPTTAPARTGDRTAVSTVRGPPTYRTRAIRQVSRPTSR